MAPVAAFAPARPTPPPIPVPPPQPLSTAAIEEEVLPTWDEPVVNALLGTNQGPITTRTLPIVAVSRLDIGSCTSPGKVRSRNEDSFLVHHLSWSNKDKGREIALAVVADGLGGHQAGDQASGLVIQMVGNALGSLLTGALTGQVKATTAQAFSQAIDNAIRGANLVVYRRSQADPSFRGMGSTVAVVLVWDGLTTIGHVGDCRVYHLRHSKLEQVTRDQTLAARMVEQGVITAQQAAHHPARNEVTQAVGRHSEIESASYHLKLIPGDWLIIACDGLHAHIDAALLEQTLRQAPPAASQVAQQLVEMTNQRGGSDNCTVVAVRCF
jgi:protein phosphatase